MNSELLTLHYDLGQIDEAAKRFWKVARNYSVIAFDGEMGAGKTTFIHHLCQLLKVEDTVSSPTFALINEYHFHDGNNEKVIYHLDWYRLRSTAEAINAGMEDCIINATKGLAYCFVEWPTKAPELLRVPHLWISIDSTSMEEREMVVESRLSTQ